MNTTTIYRINEKNCTIEIAQSVINDEKNLHSAVLNTRTFTFNELMNQHRIFTENTEVLDVFRDRLHSCLRVARSIDINAEDMLARFTAEHGENIFFRGFVTGMLEMYNSERLLLTKPQDRVKMELKKKQIQNNISENINSFFDEQLQLICNNAYLNSKYALDHFTIMPMRTIIAADDYTFNVFHESDNALTLLLAEIGQIVHRNKWIPCECGFCHKLFLDCEGKVCCKSADCITAQEQQKEQIYRENTKEYSDIKRNYDAYVRRYKQMLVLAGIDSSHPLEFDEFVQAQEERKQNMDALKKKLIRNGLPSSELYDRGEMYKKEIKALVEEILEKCS